MAACSMHESNELKLVVGLGNPGREYAETRHNVGFKTIDLLAEHLNIDLKKRKFAARFGTGHYKGKQVILIKPWQFMNQSGHSVAVAKGFYHIDLQDILVVMDDMWLSPGTIRLRASGSTGGHNGLADIIEKLGTEHFSRLRIGIGRPERQDPYDYVLSDFTDEQKPLIRQAIEKGKQAVLKWITDGIEKAMNEFNVK